MPRGMGGVLGETEALFDGGLANVLGRAAEALRESEEKYRSLVEHSLHGVLLTKPTGETLAANPAACRMLQRTEEEICALGRSGIVDTEDSRWAEFSAERARVGFARRELNMVRKDGSQVASRGLLVGVHRSRWGAAHQHLAGRSDGAQAGRTWPPSSSPMRARASRPRSSARRSCAG